MSQTPNNPFDTQPNQFGGQPQQPASSGGSKTWLWVLGILGGLFIVGSMVCCGVIYYGSSQISSLVAEAAMEEFQNDPAVQEHIGTIESSEMNFSEAISESAKDPNVAVVVFGVTGDKGSGKILHKTNNETQELTVTLVMDDGTEYPMEAADVFDELNDVEDEMRELEEMEAAELTEVEPTEIELSTEPTAEQ